MTAYRFRVHIAAADKFFLLAPTKEDALNGLHEFEFETYEEALALVESGMKTAWLPESEWRGEGFDVHCVITGAVRKRIKRYDIYAAPVDEEFHGIGTRHVSRHMRQTGDLPLITEVITDPSTLTPAAPALEVDADPVTVAAAPLPVCERPAVVRYDALHDTGYRTRAGRHGRSHFTCGAYAVQVRIAGMRERLDVDRRLLARLRTQPGSARRADLLAGWITEREAKSVHVLTAWATDPPVCTCRDTRVTLART